MLFSPLCLFGFHLIFVGELFAMMRAPICRALEYTIKVSIIISNKCYAIVGGKLCSDKK